MTFKRPLSVSSSSHRTNDKKSLSISKPCKVCGGEASVNNYGAFSCQSCKTFFRRNGFHSEIVRPCQYIGQCEVNTSTRRVCTSCRLAKCFAVGMSADLIRKEDLHSTKSSLTIKSIKIQVSKCKAMMPLSQLPTLDLPRNDRSSLTTSQWTLFSNVLHAYDTFSFIPTLNNIIKNVSSSSNEVHFDARDAFEIVGSIYTSMQQLLCSTPDFQVLSINEQRSLLERNLHGIGGFYSNLVFRDTSLFENPKCLQSFIKAYGKDTIEESQCLMKQLDLDSTLSKFMLIIIAFSSNCFMVDVHENIHNDILLFGTFRLFGSQNVYVELLWKYMIYRYGYCETVLRFTGLVSSILGMIKHASTVYTSNKNHHDFVDNVGEKTKEKLIISQNELLPLWGKTLILT